MTSTSCQTGFGAGERQSSRVLKPPGGASSNIFAAPEAAPPPKSNYKSMESGVFGSGDNVQQQKQRRDRDNSADRLFGDAAKKENPPANKEDTYNKLFGETGGQGGNAGNTRGKAPESFNPITGKSRPFQDTKKRLSNHGYSTRSSLVLSKVPSKRPMYKASNFNAITGAESADQTTAPQKTKARGSFNPITGESYGNSQPVHQSSSTKVKQPPGGASSISF